MYTPYILLPIAVILLQKMEILFIILIPYSLLFEVNMFAMLVFVLYSMIIPSPPFIFSIAPIITVV